MDQGLVQTVHTCVLRRAAELLGGNDALGVYLGVTPVRLGMWLRGSITPPGDVFLRVIDLLLEHDVASLRHRKIDGVHGDADQTSQA